MDDASSVGRALETDQVYNLEHSFYRSFAEIVEAELARVSRREALRQSTARKVVYTSALSVDQQDELRRVYPELDLRIVPMGARVHTFWSAQRHCANEWMSLHVEPYAGHVIHYGGNILSKMLQGSRCHHVETDQTDDVAVNEAHTAVVDAYRMYGDIVSMQTKHDLLLRRAEYDDYVRGRAYATCHAPESCQHQAAALCVDMSLKLMSPQQVALAMMMHGAKLAVGFFIYSPDMLVRDSGVLSSDEVGYIKTKNRINFTYPEGRAGSPGYEKLVWAQWLASHVFRVGAVESDSWFQIELLKNRGPFMFFRMVQVSRPDGPTTFTHALELPEASDKVLIKSWRLKRGLVSDPKAMSSWEPDWFTAPEKVERKVREFAMQLKPEQFTRFALKKQVRVVNNRWIVAGVAVEVCPALEPGLVESLTTAVFARTFVERYESSQLSSEMMAALKRMLSMRDAGVLSHTALLLRVCCSWVYQCTLGKVADAVRSMVDYIDSWFSSLDRLGSKIAVVPVPQYMRLSSEAMTWRSRFRESGEKLFDQSSPYGGGFHVDGGAMAASLAAVVSGFSRSRSDSIPEARSEMQSVVRVCTDMVDTRLELESAMAEPFVATVAQLNAVDSVGASRHILEMQVAERNAVEMVGNFVHTPDPDPCATLNQLYMEAFPRVARACMEFDPHSLSLDPQDLTLSAPYLRMPTHFGLVPVSRSAYRSRLTALNVPKRQNTGFELLAATIARNLDAPQVSLPQPALKIAEIWNDFLATACVDGGDGNLSARQKLAQYQSDPVALEEGALADWTAKAKPEVVQRVIDDLNASAKSLGDMDVGSYQAMVKADFKPTLSDKPLKEMTMPQVIVYHDKPLSALYSSMFRVLVRRFLSLLKPNIHINLLKDAVDIGQFITANHDFSRKWRYLENDFGKFDKSQSQFAFDLETYVFQQLGLNQEMLDKWLGGHIDCDIRSITTGMSLHVMYQRKSGDATTAFGNVIINALSVMHAYKGTDILWGVFMGDDSLVCVDKVCADNDAVQVMEQVFNLTAKYYITDAPYFASNFVIIDEARQQARMLADPIKRIEKLSMHISADDPQWHERHISLQDSLAPYRDPSSAEQLSVVVPQRYVVPEGFVRGAASALGTLVRDFAFFRGLWESEYETIQA